MRQPRLDEEAIDRVVRFCGRLKNTEDKWAGTPFEFIPWQLDDVVRPLFGTIGPDGYRQYHTCYIEIPKKSGKSGVCSPLALYLLYADGEHGAEIYSVALDRNQAGIIFGVAAAMVRRCPALDDRSKVVDSTKTILITRGPFAGSFYRVLSADAPRQHGYKPHAVFFDELHVQKKRDLYDTLTQGAMDARSQPILFLPTTAGYDRNSVCYEVHEYALKVKAGKIKDPSFLPVIYAAKETDDWESEAVWKRANPSLGYTITLDRLREHYRRAKEIPGQQSAFKRLRLNIWTQQAENWFPLSLWDAQLVNGLVVEENLVGGPCYGALDIGKVSDMTSWVMAFPDKEDPELLRFLPRFWVPEARLEDPANRYREDYRQWKKDGYLQVTPGNATDYDFVTERVIEDAARFGLVDMNIDALFQGHQVATRLVAEGIEVTPFRQGCISYTAPTKEFERRLLLRKVAHGGHPILAFNAGHVALEHHPGDTCKPVKGSPQGKVDGLQCMIMALERVMRHDATGGRSVYEDRGLTYLDIG